MRVPIGHAPLGEPAPLAFFRLLLVLPLGLLGVPFRSIIDTQSKRSSSIQSFITIEQTSY
jgi:hypothetical protein